MPRRPSKTRCGDEWRFGVLEVGPRCHAFGQGIRVAQRQKDVSGTRLWHSKNCLGAMDSYTRARRRRDKGFATREDGEIALPNGRHDRAVCASRNRFDDGDNASNPRAMRSRGHALYGGGNCFERLCLHAQRLLITSEPNLPAFYAKPPMWLDAPKLDKLFSAILSRAMDPWRNAPGGFAPDEVFRVFAPQHSGIPEIVVERLGRTLLVRHLEPDADTLWREGDMRIFAKCALRECQCDDFCYRVHESASKRHACRSLARAFDKAFDPFVACEQGIAYQFDLSGNATGLYLDQRDNRHWIAQNASGSVINLFAYTCAFSVCAAMNPNVTSTTSIDAAPAALKKGRLNFERNHIDLNGHRFIKEDAIKYLSKCVQNGTKFDTIICDPPSFGRFEKNVFSLEDDLNDLLSLCCRVAAGGFDALFDQSSKNPPFEASFCVQRGNAKSRIRTQRRFDIRQRRDRVGSRRWNRSQDDSMPF